MARITLPNILAKAGLSTDKPRLDVASAAAQAVLPQLVVAPVAAVETEIPEEKPAPKAASRAPSTSQADSTGRTRQFLRRHYLGVAALLVLAVGIAATEIGAHYWVAKHVTPVEQSIKLAKLPAKPIAGFNVTVPAAELQNKLKTVTGQPASLTVGTFSEPVSPDIIKGWMQITANKNKSEYYVHVNEKAIADSLTKEAQTYARAPVNQVTADEDGRSVAVVGGRDGRTLSDPNTLKAQAHDVAKTLLNGGGVQFSTPLAPQAFQSVTPAAYDKVLIANISAKKMWAYQNGQLVNSWLVSAGKPSTPTPIGQFRVYAKYTVQDMRGTNPDGTPYFQPHVRWISYFYQGSAVHGVYWHPLSWFGVNNSSHGCIGLPEDEAQWIYNWAPIGTTVIVHA